jgi:hypothetical protein
MALDISSLSSQDLNDLRAALGIAGDTSGRSPQRQRQLHDLTLLPTKDDPRPTFFWSAEKPRNAADLGRTTPYPRLMWETTTGREITVLNATEQATYTAQGFILTPPANAEAPDQEAIVRATLLALSPDDQRTVLLATKAARLKRVQDMAAGLGDDTFDALIASLDTPKKRTA